MKTQYSQKTLFILAFSLLINSFMFSQSCDNNIATFSPISTQYSNSYSRENKAQVFTASSTVSHFDVTLALAACKQYVCDAQLDIVTVTAGEPEWTNIIGSAIIPESEIYTYPDCIPGSFGASSFSFSGVTLNSGVQYALVLKPAPGSASNSLLKWRRSSTPTDPSNPYTGGNSWTYDIMHDMSIESTSLDLQFNICENIPVCNNIAGHTSVGDSGGFLQSTYTYHSIAQVFTANYFTSYFDVTLPLVAITDYGAQLNIVTVTNGEPDWDNVIGTAMATKDEVYKSPYPFDVSNINYGNTTFSFSNVPLTHNTQYALVLMANPNYGNLLWKASREYTTTAWEFQKSNNVSTPSYYKNPEFSICETAPPCTNNVGTYMPFGTEAKRINRAAHAAQVFTALSSVSNFNVILGLAGSIKDNLNAAQLDIVTVTNGAPDWTNVIGSATVPNDQIYSDPNREQGTFGGTTFSFNNVPITSGVQYALVLKVLPFQGASPTFSLYWQTSEIDLDGTNPYNGGNSWSYLMRYRRGLQSANHDAQFLICEASAITNKKTNAKTNTDKAIQALMLYPNPAKDVITITGLAQTETYIMYNMLGVVIGNGNVSNNEKINIQNLSNGAYVLKFENGHIKKFIKN